MNVTVIHIPINPIVTTTLKNTCPHCGYRCDQVSGTGTKGPEPGNVSICVSCKEVAMFGEGMELRRMTDDEERTLMLSDAWPSVVRLRELMIRHEGRKG